MLTQFINSEEFLYIIDKFLRHLEPSPSLRLVGSHPTKKDPCGSKNSEKVGFEPTVQITPHNTLAGCRLKPTRPLFQGITSRLFNRIMNLFI